MPSYGVNGTLDGAAANISYCAQLALCKGKHNDRSCGAAITLKKSVPCQVCQGDRSSFDGLRTRRPSSISWSCEHEGAPSDPLSLIWCIRSGNCTSYPISTSLRVRLRKPEPAGTGAKKALPLASLSKSGCSRNSDNLMKRAAPLSAAHPIF